MSSVLLQLSWSHLPSHSSELITPLLSLTSFSIILSCCSTNNHILPVWNIPSLTFLPGCCVSTVTAPVAMEGLPVLLYHILCRTQQGLRGEEAWFDSRMAEVEGLGSWLQFWEQPLVAGGGFVQDLLLLELHCFCGLWLLQKEQFHFTAEAVSREKLSTESVWVNGSGCHWLWVLQGFTRGVRVGPQGGSLAVPQWPPAGSGGLLLTCSLCCCPGSHPPSQPSSGAWCWLCCSSLSAVFHSGVEHLSHKV